MLMLTPQEEEREEGKEGGGGEKWQTTADTFSFQAHPNMAVCVAQKKERGQ